MRTFRYCNRCGAEVERETELDYPYFCPKCDENKYEFETTPLLATYCSRREDEKPLNP